MRTAGLLLVLTACGGVAQPATDPTPPRPLSADDNLAEARRREAAAQEHEDAATAAEARVRRHELTCADRVLEEQATSGGEQLLERTPCWSTAASGVDHHRKVAKRLRADARAHRARAHELIKAERTSCVGIGELSHTPFAHHDDIATVSALVEHGHVWGAEIRFRRLPDLTADWLRKAVACHQARAAALGWEPQHEGYDPTLLPGAVVEVTDSADGVVVTVRGTDELTATAIYGRAEALLDPATWPSDGAERVAK